MITGLPPCPKCGSPDTSGNGRLRIICNACGRQSNRINIPKERPDYTKRPRCPRCGTQYAIKHVFDWKCGMCGKHWPMEVQDR